MTAPADSPADEPAASPDARRDGAGHPPPRGALPLASRRTPTGLDPADAVALALSAVWALGVAAVLIFLPSGDGSGGAALRWIATLAALVLPVALIWVAAVSARAVRTLREESARLEAAVDAIRHAAAAQQPVQGSGIRAPVEAKLDEIARAQRQTEAAIARLSQPATPAAAPPRPITATGRGPVAPGRAPSSAAAGADAAQPSLALGTPDDREAEPLPNADFIRALHFPEDEGDAAGFRALRAALKDRAASALVRSAQDVLTLLSEDGIYMDDLAPDRARPEVWRRFAQGERGKGVATLGGVRDRSSLALTAGRMRQDPVFRDTAHHFLRKFDKTFADFEPKASDAEIAALAETRTARAFMLLGRVSGTFD